MRSVRGMSTQQEPPGRAVWVPRQRDALGLGLLLSGVGAMRPDEEHGSEADGEGGLWCG